MQYFTAANANPADIRREAEKRCNMASFVQIKMYLKTNKNNDI